MQSPCYPPEVNRSERGALIAERRSPTAVSLRQVRGNEKTIVPTPPSIPPNQVSAAAYKAKRHFERSRPREQCLSGLRRRTVVSVLIFLANAL